MLLLMHALNPVLVQITYASKKSIDISQITIEPDHLSGAFLRGFNISSYYILMG